MRALTTQEVILAAVWEQGAEVHAADVGLVTRDDPDDPMRTTMRQMAGVFAQLGRAMTVKRLRDGRRAKAAKGGHASGSYPYGFSKVGPVGYEKQVLAAVRALREQGRDWD